MTLPLRGDIRPVAGTGAHRTLVDLEVDIPAWMDDALCSQVDPEIFFPEVGENARPAKAVCAHCPVSQECLADALADTREQWGIRGGKTRLELRAMRRQNTAPQVCVICEVPVTGKNIRYCGPEHRAEGKQRSNDARTTRKATA